MTINKPEKQGKGWRDRFDKDFCNIDKFGNIWAKDGTLTCYEENGKLSQLKAIKHFIQSELTKAKQEAYWEGIKVMEEEADRAIAKAKTETIQSVLACRPEEKECRFQDDYDGHWEVCGTCLECSFNSALEEWENNIKELK